MYALHEILCALFFQSILCTYSFLGKEKSNEVTRTSYIFQQVTVTVTSYFSSQGTVLVTRYKIFVTSNALLKTTTLSKRSHRSLYQGFL